MSSSSTSSPTDNSSHGSVALSSFAAINAVSGTNTSTSGSQKPFSLSERLNFEIYRYSSYSPNYLPENILVDTPNDQTSRWSAYTNIPPQFLTLKLRRPAIVKKIKFGKFEKSHVCNIKKFRVFGGLEDEHMVLLLEGGLKNDNIPEVFNLRCMTEDGSENLPVLYLKIVPLLSWGPSFNFSIWYIEIHGQDDPMYTCARMKNYNTLREIEIIKLCLKHFRQQGYMSAFGALQEQTNVKLEHPLISELHKYLVVQGDFEKAERFIAECIDEGLMDEYLYKQDYKHNWHMKHTESEVKPGTRGGHQLVVDAKKRLIYLYGGWDGYQDLSDLWVYKIEEDEWTLLCERSEQSGGPTPRSCHKMIFDPISENIFILGRYLDNLIRSSECIKSDFYLYDTRARNWMQICDDTSQVGGPQLVYDHQMCIDADKRTIYVFGGKILTPRSVNATGAIEPEYSGLFSYHIATNTWTQILVDCHHTSASQTDVMSIKSRITHCMVFHNKQRKLYIYGGQRGKEDLDEFLSYDVDTQAISVLNKEHPNQGTTAGNEAKFEPSSGYTLRATIDCERDEIYVFSSLSKIKDRRDIQHMDASNSFWVYSLRQRKWSRIYYCRHSSQDGNSISRANILGANKGDVLEPCPRYAHQLVYDELANNHYLFGGNPGICQQQQLRLDDFWILSLEKPKRDEILKHCRFLVRKMRYEEMARQDPVSAMQYLRHNIADVIDHDDAEQLNNFHKLASLLFKTHDGCLEQRDSSVATPALCRNTEELDGNADVPVKADLSDGSATENISLESNESLATSGISETASSPSSSSCTKRARTECNPEFMNKRAFLFNKLVQLMPPSMVQPERNLSDFVVM
ncbi:muskelin isoform X1 [Drosophila pseudoobscura]|uniref:Muskelin isoform X1 n=1 Tax=Drosophila pseudoobscura pseudoobscura TaxID=46245 RepID=A0A6I8UV68_DROPS|nr:muskelin isoform X1 [Drosophila pseudoobscura]